MSALTAPTTELLRRAYLRMDDDFIMEAVDSLDLRGGAKISAVVGMPLRTLQSKRDVTTFALSAPPAALMGLLELLAYETLQHVIDALGDHAENPTFDQLSEALASVATAGTSTDAQIALLAFAIGEEFPAAPHCRRLFDERDDYALPVLPDTAASHATPAMKEVDPAVKEQRRLRREEEKKKKAAQAAKRNARPVKAKSAKVPAAPVTAPTAAPVVATLAEDRRRVLLTPAEAERFNPDHVLAGTVLVVEVPFDAQDPAQPDVTAKDRPAVVVAASETSLLVRAIYSNESPTRSLFTPWRRLGLDHASYIDVQRVALEVSTDEARQRLGRLSVSEWNSLF
jgi:hypothetical protein